MMGFLYYLVKFLDFVNCISEGLLFFMKCFKMIFYQFQIQLLKIIYYIYNFLLNFFNDYQFIYNVEVGKVMMKRCLRCFFLGQSGLGEDF